MEFGLDLGDRFGFGFFYVFIFRYLDVWLGVILDWRWRGERGWFGLGMGSWWCIVFFVVGIVWVVLLSFISL